MGRRSLQRKMVELLTLVALAVMWNLLAGFAGVVSVGQQAFVGLGAYSMVALVNVHDQNLYWSVPLAPARRRRCVSIPLGLDRLPSARQLLRDRHVGVGRGGQPDRDPTDVVGAGNGVSLKVAGYDLQRARTSATGSRSSSGSDRSSCPTWSCGRVSACRCRPSATTRRAHEGWARNVYRTRFAIWVLAAFWTGLAGAVFYLQNLRVQPRRGRSASCSGPRRSSSSSSSAASAPSRARSSARSSTTCCRDHSTTTRPAYLICIGVVAIVVALWLQAGIWGHIRRSLGADLFPLRRRLVRGP